MTATREKSNAATAEIADGILLDGRLAIVNEAAGWLAAADLHFGYEVSRRAQGGLFPMWGMNTVEERFAELLDSYSPKLVILAGDIVDSASASAEAGDWLERVAESVETLILIAGNHDRGAIRKRFEFCPTFETDDGFFFHHGHLMEQVPEGCTEVIGHLHPSRSLGDGAGLRLRLPSLVQERGELHERWVLPAFSPWAGGGRFDRANHAEVTEWICSPQRVFPYEP